MISRYKVVIVSDNHGRDVLDDIVSDHPDADAYIHCGDSEMNNYQVSDYVHVRGNNDYYGDFSEETTLRVGDVKFYITHSHLFSYHKRLERLLERAQQYGCQVACFGHTHMVLMKEVDGVLMLNPGSLRYNRDYSKTGYMILTWETNGSFQVEFVPY